MKKLLRYVAAIATLAMALSCEEEQPFKSRDIGQSGDGLSVYIDTKDFISQSSTQERSFHYTMSGYVPENAFVETLTEGHVSCSVEKTDVATGCITTVKALDDTASVHVLFFNGENLVFETLCLNGRRASHSRIATVSAVPTGGSFDLAFLSGRACSVSISPTDACSWLSCDLGASFETSEGQSEHSASAVRFSASANETSSLRSATITLTDGESGAALTYTVSQDCYIDFEALERERIEAEYTADFKAYVNRAGGKTHSQQTPMGKHYNGKRAVTDEDIAWFADPANEPDMTGEFPKATWETYNVKLYPFDTPSPADINQHQIGDCCACAVLAEMAYLFPDFIKHIIKANTDGSYTVAMYDPKGTPISVCVSRKFLKNSSGIVGLTGRNLTVCWSSILEKAMMKWETRFQVDGIGGIGTENVIPLFTGNGDSFCFNPGTLTNAEMKRMVEVMHHKRMFVIGGFTKSGVAIGTGTTVSGHAYSFLKSGKEGCLFAMRNPWGSNGDGSGDGVLNIPDDNTIPPMIDFRIVYPGAALDYAVSEVVPYVKPY